MTTCSHCTHRSLTAEVPLSFRKGSSAPCGLGKPWTYLHASKTCERHLPASVEVVNARRDVVRAALREVPGADD